MNIGFFCAVIKPFMTALYSASTVSSTITGLLWSLLFPLLKFHVICECTLYLHMWVAQIISEIDKQILIV